MLTNNYVTTCELSEISTLQKAKAITYSVIYDTEESSIITITVTGKEYTTTEEYKCPSNFRDCMDLITLLKENCVCPEHCIDISGDLGYDLVAIEP